MTNITHEQVVQDMVQAIMLNNLENQKKHTLRRYAMLNQDAKKGQILFVGSSLMEAFPIHEMQLMLGLNRVIYNRGISGSTTTELLAAMDTCIFELEPSKIFINIGSNDISSPDGYNKANLLKNYDEIMRQIRQKLPQCEVFVMAYYPVNAEADFGLDEAARTAIFATRTNPTIADANAAIAEVASRHQFRFIDVSTGITDENGNLKEVFSVEGLHIWPNGYAVILSNLRAYL